MSEVSVVPPPYAPASRPGFYYGWVNVVVAAVAMSATLPGRTYGLGLIKEPMRAEFGIGDVRFGEMNFVAVVLGSLIFLPPVGRLIDRVGTRRTLAIVAAALGLGVVWMAHAGGPNELLAALTLVRGLGQGALSIVAIALVSKWFRRRSGQAMGLFTLLLALGFTLPIFAVGAAVREYGWSAAWSGVGITLLVGLVPLGLLFARSSPEWHGVEPDEPAVEAGGSEPMTLRQALRTPAFWAWTAASTSFNLVFSALTFDNAKLLAERGLAAAKANETILAILMLVGLPFNILAGWMARFVPLGKLLAGGTVILAAALALFPWVRGMDAAVLYASLLGASGGIITVVYFAVYGQTYGRAHIGSIQSAVQFLSVVASASGPALLAYTRAWTGSSDGFFHTFCGVTLVLAALAWVVRPPTLKATSDE